MKKKGFTLIELIVVIAIIGVLAAILVPAMLGYVRKSKITTCNTSAKSLYNAMNTTLVDLDTSDSTDIPGDGAWTATTGTVYNKVHQYFSDIEALSNYAAQITAGACTAAAVVQGSYGGTYPTQMTVEDWIGQDGKTAQKSDSATGLLTFAARSGS